MLPLVGHTSESRSSIATLIAVVGCLFLLLLGTAFVGERASQDRRQRVVPPYGACSHVLRGVGKGLELAEDDAGARAASRSARRRAERNSADWWMTSAAAALRECGLDPLRYDPEGFSPNGRFVAVWHLDIAVTSTDGRAFARAVLACSHVHEGPRGMCTGGQPPGRLVLLSNGWIVYWLEGQAEFGLLPPPISGPETRW